MLLKITYSCIHCLSLFKTFQIEILDDNGSVKFTSALMETPEEGAVFDETIPPAYLAFSAEAIIEAVGENLFIFFFRKQNY